MRYFYALEYKIKVARENISTFAAGKFVYVLHALYKIFSNFTKIIMSHDRHRYIGKICLISL